MAERKTVHKWFWVWDFEKEERWLNEMALAGWALVSVGWCRYTFEASEPGEYTVRLEMHGYDPEYVDFMAQAKAEYVGRVLQWLYFRKRAEDGSFDIFSDIDSRISHIDRIHKSIECEHLCLECRNLCQQCRNQCADGAGYGDGEGHQIEQPESAVVYHKLSEEKGGGV